MATITKRTWTTRKGEPRETWVVRYADQDGKWRLKSFDRQREAKDWLAELLPAVKQGTHVPDSTASTLREAADAWIKRGEVDGLERSTMRQRRLHVAHILDVLDGGAKLSRISIDKLGAARDDLRSRHSRAMTRKVITSLRSILKQARAVRLLTADLSVKAASRHKPKKLKAGRDFPTAPEVKAVIDATAVDPKARSLACLAAFAGLRASELRGLAWSHLNLDKPKVTIEERADELGALGSPKSEAAKREIGLNETTVRALKEWKLAQPAGRKLVFGTASNRPDGLSNIRRRLLGPAMVKAGVVADGKPSLPKYAGLHCLRHFAISSWLKTCGGDFKAVQTRAGHATLKLTLDTYGHLLDAKDGDQIAAAERLVLG